MGKAEKSIAKTSATMTSFGAKALVAGGLIVAGLAKAIGAAEEQNLAELKLQNTIETMPTLAGASADALFEYAGSLQKVTTFGDEATIEAMALLGTFHLTEDALKKVTPLVQDYAAKYGIDLNQAAISVGKALDGNRGALQRQGIILDEEIYKTDRLGAVMAGLSENAGGFAKDQGKMFSGQLQQIKNDLGDVAEELGTGAMQGFAGLLAPVKNLTVGLHELDPAVAQGAGQVLAFGSAGMIAVGVISLISAQLIKAKAGYIAFRTAMAKPTAGQAVAGLAGGVLALVMAVVQLKGAYETARQSAREANEGFKETGIEKAATMGVGALDAQIEEMRVQYNGLVQDIDNSKAPWDKDYRDQLGEYNEMLLGSYKELQEYRAEITAYAKAQGISEDAAAQRMLAEQRKTDALEAGATQEQATAKALEATREGYDEVKKAIDEARGHLEEHYELQDRLLNGAIDWEAGFDDLTAQIIEHGNTLNIDTEAGRENVSALLDLGAAARQNTLDTLEQTGSVEEASAAFDRQRQKLIDQLTVWGWSEEAIDNYITTANLTPADKETILRVYDDQALTDLGYYQGEIDKIPEAIQTAVRITGNITDVLQRATGIHPKGRAGGGTQMAGEAGIMNEPGYGGEVFVPGATGTVVPASSIASAAGGGGGGGYNGPDTLVVNVGDETVAELALAALIRDPQERD